MPSDFKIAGACTLCDKPCFEVMQVYEAHERLPGEPKRLGPPFEDAARVTFLLMDGSKMSLTFCEACAVALAPEQYIDIWRKVLRSWMREIVGNEARHMNWFPPQFANSLLCELGREPWKELMNG